MHDVVGQTIEAYMRIRGKEYLVLEAEAELSLYNDADMVEATVVPWDHDGEPDRNDEIVLEINDHLIFTGTILASAYKGDGSFTLKALDDSLKVLNHTIEELSISGPTLLSRIVRHVCREAGVDFEMNLVNREAVRRRDGDVDTAAGIDYPVKIERTETSAANILNRLAELANAIWWVDKENILQFGPPESALRPIDYVLESSAGKTTPPYRGVEVIGQDSVTAHGWEATYIESKQAITVERGIWHDAEEGWKIVKGETNEPVFTVEDKSLVTRDMAKATADSVIGELVQQLKSGHVKIVGQEKIGKMDIIQMPSIMGDEKYYVGKVIQRLDSSDGFTTKIECQGLVPDYYYATEGVGSDVRFA